MSTTETISDEATLRSNLKRSAKRFYETAVAQEWDIQVVALNKFYTQIKISNPEAGPHNIDHLAVDFDAETGAFVQNSRFTVRQTDGTSKPHWKRDHKLGDLVSFAARGPKTLREEAERKAKRDAEVAAKAAAERTALDSVADVEAIRNMVNHTRMERDRAANSLRNSLEVIRDRAHRAMDALDAGHVPDTFGGSVLGNSMADLDIHAGTLKALSIQLERLEWAFGPAENLWMSGWESYSEKSRKAKADEKD